MARRPTGGAPGRPRSAQLVRVLELRGEGLSFVAIGERLGIGARTAKNYLSQARGSNGPRRRRRRGGAG